MAIMIISGDSIFVHLNTLFVSNLREMNSLFFFLGHKSTRSEMGKCFISSALILARGSSGLLFMLVKELRRILEQLCARVWEPLHYLRWKQTREAPFDPWVPMTFGFSLGGSGPSLQRVRPAATCLLSFPRHAWESGSCPDLQPTIFPSQDVPTCRSVFFQVEGIQAASSRRNGNKVQFLGILHCPPPRHPSLPLHVHCFPDLRFSLICCYKKKRGGSKNLILVKSSPAAFWRKIREDGSQPNEFLMEDSQAPASREGGDAVDGPSKPQTSVILDPQSQQKEVSKAIPVQPAALQISPGRKSFPPGSTF